MDERRLNQDLINQFSQTLLAISGRPWWFTCTHYTGADIRIKTIFRCHALFYNGCILYSHVHKCLNIRPSSPSVYAARTLHYSTTNFFPFLFKCKKNRFFVQKSEACSFKIVQGNNIHPWLYQPWHWNGKLPPLSLPYVS